MKTNDEIGASMEPLRKQVAAQQAVQPVAPDDWRDQFSESVYEDLSAACNQDVPLEEYPARILNILDAIVGPRHPTVIKWRNDAIRSCIAIAYKYCSDPESYRYLKQDLEAMLAAPAHPAEGVHAQAVTKVQQTAPKVIHLNIGPDAEDCDFKDLCSVTWCDHDATYGSIQYVRADLAATQPAAQGFDVVQAAKSLCKHAAKVQNINFDDYWLIHAEEFKEEAQIVLDAAQAKNGEQECTSARES